MTLDKHKFTQNADDKEYKQIPKGKTEKKKEQEESGKGGCIKWSTRFK